MKARNTPQSLQKGHQVMTRALALLLAALLMPTLAHAQASTTSDHEDTSSSRAKGFGDVPVALRAYFDAARRADLIKQPLQRCLEFPDLPGVQGPRGYGEAHCHYHHGATMSLEDVKRLLDAGQLDTLDSQARAALAVHEVEGAKQESSHLFFAQFDGETDATGPRESAVSIAARWAAAAPRSAIAATAHGFALKQLGWTARGEKFSGETPREQMAEMSRQFDLAERELRRAIGLDAQMLDAYVTLVDIGKADRDEVGKWAFERAVRIDPGCGELAYRRMQSLTPRWGGSLEAMEAYAQTLRPHVARRPLLANQLAEPAVQLGWQLRDNKEAKQHVQVALEEALKTSHNEDGMEALAELLRDGEPKPEQVTRAMALLLQTSRFKPLEAWSGRAAGRYLSERAPTWAVVVLERALPLTKDRPGVHLELAGAHHWNKNWKKAEAHYVEAAKDTDYLGSALSNLIPMLVYVENDNPAPLFKSAEAHIQRFYREYPDHQDAMYYMVYLKGLQSPSQWDLPLMRRFLAAAGQTSDEEKRRYGNVQKILTKLESKTVEPMGVDY